MMCIFVVHVCVCVCVLYMGFVVLLGHKSVSYIKFGNKSAMFSCAPGLLRDSKYTYFELFCLDAGLISTLIKVFLHSVSF